MTSRFSIAALIAAVVFLAAASARAQPLQSPRDCVIGKRVSTSAGRKGTITRVDVAWSYCYVRFDDTGEVISYLYSLLRSEDEPSRAGQLRPALGVYECVSKEDARIRVTMLLLRVTGLDTYSVSGAAGRFRVEQSGKVIFESGPLKEYHSQLLADGRIGLDPEHDEFSRISCELNRNLR
jgi:hypothetical protein